MTTTQGGITQFARSFPPYMHMGLCPFWAKQEIEAVSEFTLADDVIFIGQAFPQGSYWPAFLSAGEIFRISVPELDTGTAVEFDVGFADDDGVIDVLLINDSAAGQAGGVDVNDADAANLYLDISGKRLCVKIVTPPTTDDTAAVGDFIEVAGLYCNGVIQNQKDPSL